MCVPLFVLIRMSELGLGEPGQSSGQPYVPPSHPPSHSSPYNPHTVTPSHANYAHQFPGSPSQPSHYSPHTVTPSHTYTHQFPGSPSQPSHYSPHTVTPSQHGMQFTPSHIPPTHTPSDGGPYGAVASTGYPTGTLYMHWVTFFHFYICMYMYTCTCTLYMYNVHVVLCVIYMYGCLQPRELWFIDLIMCMYIQLFSLKLAVCLECFHLLCLALFCLHVHVYMLLRCTCFYDVHASTMYMPLRCTCFYDVHASTMYMLL